ncbi:MAG: peptidylprolyl isomerase [Opitutae bacterium]|nr:peptidylprolyl isomerase [Opitutae bacterium]
MRRLLFVFACAALSLGAQEKSPAASAHATAHATAPAAPDTALPDGLYAEFTTPHGAFVAELFYRQTPMTVASFVGRAETGIAARDGKPFFSGLTWYRVVPNFVVQSGDPIRSAMKPEAKSTDADDEAGHPFPFPDEIVPGLHHDAAGVLSMANGGPDTNSSEFFITLRDTGRLNYLHSVFGRVVRGVELLPQIKQDESFSVKILRVGAAAKAFKTDQIAFAQLVDAAKKYSAAREPGPAAHFDDPDKLLPQDVPRAQNFNYKLANFERFTGRRIVARVFAKSPSAAEDAQPGAYMSALAKKLGTDRAGVLAVYFADEKDWRIWFGDEVVSTFLRRPATAADLVPDGPLHQAKMAFIDAAVTRGDADYAAQQKAAPADHQPPPAQHLKLQVDWIVDGLIDVLEPKK